MTLISFREFYFFNIEYQMSNRVTRERLAAYDATFQYNTFDAASD